MLVNNKHIAMLLRWFLPRDAMLTQYMPSSCICPSVCVCVCHTLVLCKNG